MPNNWLLLRDHDRTQRIGGWRKFTQEGRQLVVKGELCLVVAKAREADLHDVNLEGPSGILQTAGADPVAKWVGYKRCLEWPTGAQCVFFSGEEPESLRGPQCELCVIDEIARMRYQQQVFDQMMLGLRPGDRPRVLIATAAVPRA